MRKYFICFVLLLGLNKLYAQQITYQKNFDETLALAAKTNRPVFILIGPPARPEFNGLDPANALDEASVVSYYRKTFISYKVALTDTSAGRLRNLFHPSIFPALIFLDAKGNLLFKSGGSFHDAGPYIEMANKAMDRLLSGKTISYYEQLDKEGKLDREQLKQYITLREGLDMFDNAELIDRYVALSDSSELRDYKEVLFVFKAGPYAYDKAYRKVYDKKIVDSIYKHQPVNLLKNINNYIISNTINQAIKSKNMGMAFNAANYARGTWGKDVTSGVKSYQNELLIYYYGIKDTANYFRTALNFYDTYYMSISPDSAGEHVQHKTIDTPAMKRMLGANSVFMIQPSSGVAGVLNTVALNFYSSGTKNPVYLKKALSWSRRSVELQPLYIYYDTMAHLMYRLNLYDEALLNQQKAIDMAAEMPIMPTIITDRLKSELQKMKARQL